MRRASKCGAGGQREVSVSADFGIPIASGFRDSEMHWAVCPEQQDHCCTARLLSLLLGRGSIDPCSQRQLEHIWLPDECGSSQPGGS